MGNAQQVGALLGKKEFPYDIEDVYAETFLWKVHRGKRKSDNEVVTIFKFDFDNTTPQDKIELAKGSLKRLRAIRHPSVVTFLDGVELSNTIFIVTEYVVPLSVEIQNIKTQLSAPEMIAWGLYQVAKALMFLHGNNLYHCNVNIDSVFVDIGGDWKIGELGFLTSFQSSNGGVVNPSEAAYGVPVKRFFNYIPNKYRPLEVASQRWDYVDANPSKIDSWGFACLIYEIFEGPMNVPDDLKKINLPKIPKTLRVAFDQLTDKNVKMRLELSNLLENPYFNNSLIELQLFLENITIKDAISVETFLNRLPDLLPQLPRNNMKNKVLPSLIQLIKFGTAGQKAIVPIMKLGTLLNEDEYKTVFIPKVLDLFEIADRTVRVNLLKGIDHIAIYLTQDQAENVYEHVSKGFRDTSPILREMTVKSMIAIVPKLKEETIDNSVVRYMWALQGDKENAIRTNTIIAFGKLAPNLSEKTRKRILLAAFVRSLKDPFVHSRLSSLKALLSTKQYYSVSDMAVKALPFVVSLTVDPEKQVRDLAFVVLNDFLKTISEVSEQPNFNEIINSERNAETNSTLTSGGQNQGGSDSSNVGSDYFSWAMKSLKTKVLGENPTQPSSSTPSSGSTSNQTSTSNITSSYGSTSAPQTTGTTPIYKPVVLSNSSTQPQQPQRTQSQQQDPFSQMTASLQAKSNTSSSPNMNKKLEPQKATNSLKLAKTTNNDPFDDFFDMSDDSGTNSNALGNMTTGSSDLLDDDWSSWDNLDSIVPSSSKQSSQQPNKTTSQPLKLSHSTTGTTTVNKSTSNTSNNNLLEDDFFSSMQSNPPTSKKTNLMQPTTATTTSTNASVQQNRTSPMPTSGSTSNKTQNTANKTTTSSQNSNKKTSNANNGWSDNWEEW